MKYLALIPARGGSKGVPKKNIKKLNGKPLIQYTIEAAQAIFEDKDIIVSTDSEEIKEVVEKTGLKVPFLRPKELATDTAGSYEVILHALNFVESNGEKYDTLVLLQPTSPLRNGEHIKEALALYSKECDMVVSVKESKANPYYNLFEESNTGFLEKSKSGAFTRRQDVPSVWEYNGAIYVINIDAVRKSKLHEFQKVKKYVMDETASLDIDTPFDFKMVEFMLNRKK